MIAALPKAAEIWREPDDMLAMWDFSPSKSSHEKLVASWVGHVGTVADLGCGVGRYACVLDCDKYFGIDSSLPMIMHAKDHSRNERCSFTVADVFGFASGRIYDVVTMIDVAYHQNEPIDALLRATQLWVANRYIMTLLVGDRREDLYASTVVPFSDLLRFLKEVNLQRMHIEQSGPEPFAWVLLEVKRE
jgi:SAM-dependent methyltransferase